VLADDANVVLMVVLDKDIGSEGVVKRLFMSERSDRRKKQKNQQANKGKIRPFTYIHIIMYYTNNGGVGVVYSNSGSEQCSSKSK
jgi:hypothetical protein